MNTPEQRESIHAARGTATHQVAEKMLRGGPTPKLGDIEATKGHQIEVDEEILASAEMYVGYVIDTVRCSGAGTAPLLMIEQRFDLGPLGGPFEAGGTADAVIYDGYLKRLQVIDLKHGMGVVDVKGNPQLRTYALGALLANPGLAVDQVTVTIVQPRAPHRDGKIRSETFHVADLIDWTADLLVAMRRSKQAADEHAACGGNAVLLEAWAEKWLRPGKCKFCAAEGWCPKLRKKSLDVAGLWFDDMDRPKLNAPAEQSPEAVARDLAALDMLEDWIKARRAYAHALAEAGTPPPGYRLVDSYGHRKWGAPEAKIVADLKAVAGLDADDVYDRKLKTPAAIDKIVGKAGAEKLKSMWLKQITGRTLVKADATDRPDAPAMADRYFEATE
ncbi:hypothetical protein ASF22_02505 [Methylobacterium sp. Leaf87]|nr:hypothetical protein ASF22_02505 [Methylobacterium sp. Leaf87]